MTQFKNAFEEYQRKRWMRPDASRFVRPDWQCFARPGAEREFLAALYDRKYSPDQPRVPRGYSEGGQWTTGNYRVVSSGGGISIAVPAGDGIGGDGELGDLGLGDVAAGLDAPLGDLGSEFDSEFGDTLPGAQLAGDIPTGDSPPEIPKERPSTTRGLNRAARAAARRFPVIELLLEAYPYLSERQAEIRASFDPPRTLQELQDAVSRPEKGYDIHHIVERATRARDGSEDALIDAPENLIKIPRFKHWELNGWYERQNEAFGGLTPREYLKGKSWDERTRVGLMGLRDVGVLK